MRDIIDFLICTTIPCRTAVYPVDLLYVLSYIISPYTQTLQGIQQAVQMETGIEYENNLQNVSSRPSQRSEGQFRRTMSFSSECPECNWSWS